jgi:glycosyltransferase
MIKISIITAVLNGRNTIADTLESILNQSYKNVEHVIIDGGSTDETLEILKRYKNGTTKIISEPDGGVYEALNKGIQLSSGDVIGILNGDDFYAHGQVLNRVVDVFEREKVDSCYGDLQYVKRDNTSKLIRFWKSSPYRPGKFNYGWMPPHPTFFVKKEIYEKFGIFNTDLKIAADYELMLRFLERFKISTHYIPEVLIKMRVGGMSNRNLRNMFLKSCEDYKAWKVNDLKSPFYTILLKNISKIPQFLT